MLCYNCMHEKGNMRFCTQCGVEKITDTANHHLIPGTVIGGRYILGRVLGEGGFGITYIGLDRILDIPVAVKEYYPYGYSHRSNTYSNTVFVSSGEHQEIYEKGKKRFLSEAKHVARFRNEPGIVDVTDFIEENSTAYIVMEYLDGIDLRRLLRKNGTMTVEETLCLMKPIMKALGKMHASGVIHRDIAPDNLMYMKDGSLRLMDFGAARAYAGDNRSMSIMLKQGYAPEEQYRSSGKQGPWTDVYGICATIYRCITGTTPSDSLDRLHEDTLKKPSELGVEISEAMEDTLMYGLAVRAEDRCRSMDELLRRIEEAEKAPANDLPAPEPPTDPDSTVYDGTGYRDGDPPTDPSEPIVSYESEEDADLTVPAHENDSGYPAAADDETGVELTVPADETENDELTIPADETVDNEQTLPLGDAAADDQTVLADEAPHTVQLPYHNDIPDDSPTMLFTETEPVTSYVTHNSLLYDRTNDPYHQRMPGPNEWKCPRCGKIQMIYVGTCGCGQPKPGGVRGYVPSAGGGIWSEWRCPRCGKSNVGAAGFCSCGQPKPGAPAPQAPNMRTPGPNEWKCPKCGRINMNYVGTCGCGQPQAGALRMDRAYVQQGQPVRQQRVNISQPQQVYSPQPQQRYPAQPQNGWYCPNCGRFNMNYVGTCGCGRVKPQFIPPKR